MEPGLGSTSTRSTGMKSMACLWRHCQASCSLSTCGQNTTWPRRFGSTCSSLSSYSGSLTPRSRASSSESKRSSGTQISASWWTTPRQALLRRCVAISSSSSACHFGFGSSIRVLTDSCHAGVRVFIYEIKKSPDLVWVRGRCRLAIQHLSQKRQMIV